MPIFKNAGGKLKKLNMVPLDKEKALQQLLEANLLEVLELRFLATEYKTTLGGRIDTLAVDANGAPVIIEYKRNKNDNVINQALSYLKWLKTQQPGFFEKLMNDRLGKQVAEGIALDWHSPRVICVAESYSKFDVDTVEVVPLRIELFRYRYYEGGLFSLEPVSGHSDTAKVVMTGAGKGAKKADKAAPDAPTVEALVQKASPQTRALFDSLRERTLALGEDIVEKPTRFYIAYRASKNFAEVHVAKNQIRVHLRPVNYDDPAGLVEKVPDSFGWTMDRRVLLSAEKDLDYVMSLIEQSYGDVL